MEASKATNPYQTPTGDLSVGGEEYGEIRFFSPSTRIGRMRYLSHSFLIGLCSYLFFIPATFLVTSTFAVLGFVLLAVGYIAVVIPMIIIGIQRLHDLDKSGWLTFVYLVPLVNFVLMLYVLCAPGTEGDNTYGKQPPPNKTWNIVCGWFCLAFPILGIITAIALPAYQSYVTGGL